MKKHRFDEGRKTRKTNNSETGEEERNKKPNDEVAAPKEAEPRRPGLTSHAEPDKNNKLCCAETCVASRVVRTQPVPNPVCRKPCVQKAESSARSGSFDFG